MKGDNLKVKRDSRSRVWDFVLYPESLPANWKSYIEELAVPVAISPLHDRDTYSSDEVVKLSDGSETVKHVKGETKKPHYHGVIKFEGKKSFKQIMEMLSPLNCPRVEPTNSLISMVRYFCHLDSPGKAQYDSKDILTFNGIHIKKAFEVDKDDYTSIVGDLLKIIDSNEVTEFYQFMQIVYEFNSEWACVAVKYQSLFSNYIRSKRNFLANSLRLSCSSNRNKKDSFESVKDRDVVVTQDDIDDGVLDKDILDFAKKLDDTLK